MTPQKNVRRLKSPVGEIFSILSLVIITLFVLTGCSKKEEPVKKEVIRPAKIMTITDADSTENFKFPGKVQALDRVELSFEVSGKIIEVAVKEGQHVKKGDLIARIDSRDYKHELEARQAAVNQTQAEVTRYAALLKEKVVAKSTYDVKQRDYEVAVAAMNIALKAFDDTNLRATFSGIIGKRFIDNYQVIQAKESVVSLQKISAVEVLVNAPENIISNRSKDLSIKYAAVFANYPDDRFSLQLKEFATEADSQTQTFRITFRMPMPKGKAILDGMTATVFIKIGHEGKKAVEVPVQAVFYDENGQAYVWKTNQDLKISRHPVEAGTLTNDGNITISSGLISGDRIIAAGVQTLTEGLKVREYTGTMGE